MYRYSKGSAMLLCCVVLWGSLSGCGEEEKKKLDVCSKELKSMKAENESLKKKVTAMTGAAQKADEELKASAEARKELAKQARSAKERLLTIRDILEKLKIVIAAGDLKVKVKRGKMVLELPSAILFASGKADLSDKGKETLTKVAQVLKDIKGREFQVAGHTDNVKVSEDNPFGDNWHLSTARGVSVVQYLIEAGLNPRNLSAAGYAQYKPAASNNKTWGKARNRRIEITLMPSLKELPNLTDIEKEFNLGEKTEKK